MGITQAQAKTNSTNTNQTTAPANSANRYTGNFNPAHHSIALIILIFLILHDVVYLLQHPCLCTTHSKAATRNTADLKTVKLL
jgi:hypothetical protein